MQQAATKLCTIFQDNNFAWELLNAEIQIEMRNLVSGQTIAYLLQLYMRGVERMNSLADPRQSYFKNKVTALMSQQTVIKSLKENPMKKKSKPDEVQVKQEPKQIKKQHEGEKTPKKKKVKAKKQQSKQQQKEPIKDPEIIKLQLRQKRKQLEMRMAYVAEQHGPDSLKKIIAQEDHREQNISNKISKIINSHQERLNERIKARKLRTATFKTRSEVNMQEAQSLMSQQYHQNGNIQIGESFSPFEKISLDVKMMQERNLNCSNTKQNEKMLQRHKSLELIRNIDDSPQRRVRKYTFDFTRVGNINEP